MNKLLLICTYLILSFICRGQEVGKSTLNSYAHNSTYIELFGNSIFFGSLNYERIILQKDFFYLSGRIGIGYGSSLGLGKSVLSMPVLINGIFQIYHTLAFEAGFGISFMQVGSYSDYTHGEWVYRDEIAPTGILGMRIQAKNGFLFRFDYTPFYANLEDRGTDNILHSSFGLSIGYSFGKK